MRREAILCGVVLCVTLASASARAENGPRPIYAQPQVEPAQATQKSSAVTSRATAVRAPQPPRPIKRSAVEGQPISAPGMAGASRTQEAALLKQKLAERDQLQREIDELRKATRTVEQVMVKVQMLEVNRTRLRELGIDVQLPNGQMESADVEKLLSRRIDTPDANAEMSSTFKGEAMAAFVEALERNNVAKVLAEPKIVTVSGRPAKFHVGGDVPIANADGKNGISFRNYGTEVQLVAETLGENRVRLQVEPRLSEIDESRSIQVGDQKIPAMKIRQCSFTTEVECGKSAVVSGLVQERTEAVKTEAGVTPKTVEIALMIVVTPEIVK